MKINNIAELKTRKGTSNANVEVLGYYTSGDGGGGNFYWDNTSTEVDNGGTIIQVTSVTTGRWKRIIIENKVSIKDFGAISGGATNNSTILQLALNYASSSKTALFINEGEYLSTTQLNIGNNTEIFGLGDNSIISTSGVNTVFRVESKDNIHISNIKIKGSAGGSLISGIGVQFLFCNNISVFGCSMVDLSLDALDFYQCTNFNISNNYIYNSYGNGITIRNGSIGFNVKSNYILENGREGGSSLGKGISVSCQNSLPNLGCSNGHIDNNYIKDNNQIGIELFSTFDLVDAARNKNISINGNKIIQSSPTTGFKFGVSIAGSDNCTGSNNYSENCVIGFEIADSTYCSYVNNVSIGSTYSAFTISGAIVPPVHINIIGNTAKSTTGDRGVLITDEAKYINIQSNNIDINSGRGLELVNANNEHVYISIIGNIFSNSQKSGIYIQDANSVIVKDNIVFGNNIDLSPTEDDIYLSLTAPQIATSFFKDNIKTSISDYRTVEASTILGGTQPTSSVVYQTTSGVGSTGADHIFKVGNNGSKTAMRILNNGSVGIGTDNPHNYGSNYSIFQVAGVGGFGGFVQVTDSTGSAGVLEMYGGANDCQFGTRTNTDLKIKTNDTTRVWLKANGELGVGADITDASVLFQLSSTTKGFRPPVMTTTQRNAISSPMVGLIVFDTTLNKLFVRGASSWEQITSV